MAVLLVQLQAPDAGLYSIPWTDCTENPSEVGSEKSEEGIGAWRQHHNMQTFLWFETHSNAYKNTWYAVLFRFY